MLTYYRRLWDETRSDEFNAWGTSIWYFEVGLEGFPARQLELYASGIALRYDQSHVEDHFGGLSEAALDRMEFAAFIIPSEEFELAWASYPSHNPQA